MLKAICVAACSTVLSLIGAGSATATTTLCVAHATSGCFATIQAAVDAASKGDTIRVAAGTFAGGITITKSVQVVGVSAGATIVKGGGPVVTIGQFEGDNGGVQVVISRMTITGGVTDTPGTAGAGGISIPQSRGQATGATVRIDDSVISDNEAAPSATFSTDNPGPCNNVPQQECAFASGGGIGNAGNLALTRTLVIGNVAGSPGITHYAFGGGISNGPQGTLSLSWSVVSGNRATVSPPDGRFSEGGGIEDFGTMTIAFSQITGNSSVVVSSVPSSLLGGRVEQNADAGGVDLASRGTATIDSSTISGNTVSDFDSNGDAQAFNGGIDDDGTLQITGSIGDRNNVTAAVPDGSGLVAAVNSGGLGLTGTATIRFSHIGGNSLEARSANGFAFVGGAGVGDFSGHLTVDRTLITGNTGAATSGAATISFGGGILETSFGGPPPQMTVSDSVVVANRLTGTAGTPQGAGIYNGGLGGGGPYPLTITHTVIQGNSPDQCVGC
jgi:hypothetical protein